MIDLKIETDGIRPTLAALDATEAQVQRALRSTLSKLARWARSRATKGMAKEVKMNQTTFRRRLRVSKVRSASRGGSKVTVWFGLNPVGIIYLRPRQTSRGVSAMGGRHIRSAFIATMESSKRGVFKRRGKARLKIDLQREDIEDPGEKLMTDGLAKSPEMEAKFVGIFERELRWQMRKQ